MDNIKCPYCGKNAELKDYSFIYGQIYDNLAKKYNLGNIEEATLKLKKLK